MLFLLGIIVGGVIGALVMAAIAMAHVRKVEEDAVLHSTAVMDLSLLRARLRAIQQHGKSMGKGERMYVVQSPNGKFAKLTLPEV